MAFILIVDDNDDIAPLEIALASNGGPRVVVLTDGRLALQLLQTDPPIWRLSSPIFIFRL